MFIGASVIIQHLPLFTLWLIDECFLLRNILFETSIYQFHLQKVIQDMSKIPKKNNTWELSHLTPGLIYKTRLGLCTAHVTN